MNVKYLNPFLEAAFEVVRVETGVNLSRGDLKLDKEPYVTDDVTVVLSLVGRIEGNVFYSMSKQTAVSLASSMLGEQLDEFDPLAQSGIAELGNVITGQASIKLSQTGFEVNISPPSLILGRGATISTLDYPRLVVPLTGECGPLVIHLALREGAKLNTRTVDIPVPVKPSVS